MLSGTTRTGLLEHRQWGHKHGLITSYYDVAAIDPCNNLVCRINNFNVASLIQRGLLGINRDRSSLPPPFLYAR